MILVVADTTPLRYLVEIGLEGLLPALFEGIRVPGAVVVELRNAGAPAVVREWAARFPCWVVVSEVEGDPSAVDASGLGRGEWEALELAARIRAQLVLIDERAGARVARLRGFQVTGTLGVLVAAARANLVSIDEALGRLGRTNFRVSRDLVERVRAEGKRGR